MIHCVPLKEKYKEVKGEREMNTYNPNPIDTSDVVLTPNYWRLLKSWQKIRMMYGQREELNRVGNTAKQEMMIRNFILA